MSDNASPKKGFAEVNGLKMYYEIHGEGSPLVLIHGGGSTIETTFGRIIAPLSGNRMLIAVELQAHGHTNDRDMDLSFEQDADDIAELLKTLSIKKADFLGFSNGGNTAIEIALRHPGILRKLILASIIYKRSAAPDEFWEGFEGVTLDMIPEPLAQGYLEANNDKEGLLNMFNKDVQRMKVFRGWTDDQMRSIVAPTLVINGNNDVGSPEHAVEIYRVIPNTELAIFPGGHGSYLGEIASTVNGSLPKFNVIELVEEFLDKP